MTTTRALKDVSLNDLILPEDALDNIIEEGELNEKLELYSTTAEMNNAINTAVSRCALQADVDQMQTTLQNNIDQKANISAEEQAEAAIAKCSQFEAALGSFKFAVLDQADYDSIEVPDENTIYFIKAAEVQNEPDAEPPANDENASPTE